MSRHDPMHQALFVIVRVSFLIVLVAAIGVGCEGPAGEASPTRSAVPPAAPTPGAVSPVAPAIEPRPTGPDRTIEIPGGIELPSVEPIAPAIQPERTEPERTISAPGWLSSSPP